MWGKRVAFETFKDLTFSSVVRGDDEILFITQDGKQFRMFHEQDCCESVSIEDIAGDLNDLVGSPILFAEESINPEGYGSKGGCGIYDDSCTWTFYRIGTVKGTVVIRWYGTSNGYYSESVNIEEVIK